MLKNNMELIRTVFSLILAASILYVYSTLAANTKKITIIETRQENITDIRSDIKELRKGQREILKLLITY